MRKIDCFGCGFSGLFRSLEWMHTMDKRSRRRQVASKWSEAKGTQIKMKNDAAEDESDRRLMADRGGSVVGRAGDRRESQRGLQ